MDNKPSLDPQDYQICKAQCSSLREKIKEQRDSVDKVLLKNEAAKNELDQLPGLQFDLFKTLKGHFGKIYSSQWNSASTMICSASQDGTLVIWNASTSNKKLAIKLQSAWVMSCTFSPSSKYVACGGLDNLCSIYDIENQQGFDDSIPWRELQQHEGYLSSVRFFGEDRIVSASGDSTCILWNILGKKPEMTFNDHSGDVMCIAIDKNGQKFISGSCDATIKLWDIRTGKCEGNYTGHKSDVNSVDWFPDHCGFASGSDDSTCRLFDIRAYRQLNHYENSQSECGVTSVSFSNSGRLLFAGYDDDPFCLGWDVAYGEPVAKLDHTLRVSDVAVAPNGGAICTGSWDKTLRLWIGK